MENFYLSRVLKSPSVFKENYVNVYYHPYIVQQCKSILGFYYTYSTNFYRVVTEYKHSFGYLEYENK